MDRPRKDPLLIIAKLLTIVVRVFLMIGMVALGIGLAGTAIASAGWLPGEVLIEMGPDLTSAPLWIVALALAAGLVSLGLMFDFVRLLAQIIDTVSIGDPFVMANAQRLTRMAWLALAVQATSLAAGLLGDWAERRIPQAQLEFSSDFTLTGLGLALTLFILARVFREGARMRDELEGTV